jgi:hypothetical protein
MTSALKHPACHSCIDERVSRYQSIGQALEDKEDRTSRRKWAPAPSALESARGHESEIRRLEFVTQRNGRITLAIQWALADGQRDRDHNSDPLALSFRYRTTFWRALGRHGGSGAVNGERRAYFSVRGWVGIGWEDAIDTRCAQWS